MSMVALELPTGYEDREYQEIGTRFLRTIERGFLTDQPGLGKTPQAIKATELPALVVAPKYLTGQWEEAIRREHSDAVIAHADGTRSQRDKILSTTADWYIVNLEMLATYALPTGIRTFINDESHHLRNRTARHSKAAKLIENKDPKARIYNLTATPMWKSPADIWMQAHILYPQVFTSYHKFVELYCMTLVGPYGPKVIGIRKSMRGPLKELLSPIMLGRSYADVGRFLPEIVESTVSIRLPKLQQAIYDKLVEEYSIRWQEDEKKMIFTATTVLHALRQVTAFSGKFEAIHSILEDNNDIPTVIGFWYRDHARMMYEQLGSKRAVLVTGDLDAVERQKLAMWAQRNGKHIVASQMSLAEGVNLSQYRCFIFGEENYVPGSNHQFLSRVVRDRNDNGKDREPVRVFYVQATGTIDTIIHRVTKSRRTAIEATRALLEQTFDKR